MCVCVCLELPPFLAFTDVLHLVFVPIVRTAALHWFPRSLRQPLYLLLCSGRFHMVIVTAVWLAILSAIMASSTLSALLRSTVAPVLAGISIFVTYAEFGDGLFSSRRQLLGNLPDFAMWRTSITTLWTLSTTFFRSSLMCQCWENISCGGLLFQGLNAKFRDGSKLLSPSEWLSKIASSNPH